jgi:DNA-binding protein HU-beta
MNKSELINAIAKDAKISKVAANAAIDSFIKSTTSALKKGGNLILVGFGTFSTAKRGARTGRNPQTGKAIKIAAKTVAKFKAGSGLKKAVNK